MNQDNDILSIPEEVVSYLRKLRKRERQLIYKKKFLKTRFLDMGGRLKLLEGRDEDLPCMVSSKNVYQLSTVRVVRENLVRMLATTSEDYVKCYLELSIVQRSLNQDLQTTLRNLNQNQMPSNAIEQN
ncbi:uncharacterized protein LOC110178965 [Drosophila serrata]|uniref:uncharacterized protein LOC110178965 n=1 Tax=Drosophila serrata TaxID=7274 RepID=UPI000A1D37B5|nr:uncharacterized protein LOC110178965 [Drosophila serrata]